MREMGFAEVVEKHYYWPSSPWAKGEHLKRVSQICRRDMTGNIDGADDEDLYAGAGLVAGGGEGFYAAGRQGLL
jgi:hypothetical protein